MAALNQEQMPYILAVVRAGSLREATEQLITTHVRINRPIMALETSYDVLLFQRSRAAVKPTTTGRWLLPW